MNKTQRIKLWIVVYLIIVLIVQLVVMSKHMERQDEELERLERFMIKNFNELNRKTAPFKIERVEPTKPNQS